MVSIPRRDYAALYGPTVGDGVRLADTSLIAVVEKDHAVYGDECLHGGGKTLRDGIGLAAGKPVVGLTTLAAMAVPFIDADDTKSLLVVIDARHDHVYMQLYGPGGRTLVAPRVVAMFIRCTNTAV